MVLQEEALGEEMAQLEEQCTAAELESEESQKKAASFELQIAEVYGALEMTSVAVG